MMVIIHGNNRVEICDVKLQDQEKHFFQSRGQLYKVYPDSLTRIDIIDNTGKEIKKTSDECVIFTENNIKPHLTRGVDYSPDTILRQIDEHKLNTKRTLFSSGEIFFKQASKVFMQIFPYMGLIITGLIVLWAFLQ